MLWIIVLSVIAASVLLGVICFWLELRAGNGVRLK